MTSPSYRGELEKLEVFRAMVVSANLSAGHAHTELQAVSPVLESKALSDARVRLVKQLHRAAVLAEQLRTMAHQLETVEIPALLAAIPSPPSTATLDV